MAGPPGRRGPGLAPELPPGECRGSGRRWKPDCPPLFSHATAFANSRISFINVSFRRIQVMERMDPLRSTGWFVMAKHRRLSAARRRPAGVIAGYCRCSTGAAGLPRQQHGEPLSLAPRQRCAGPRRGAVRHPAPAHSTRCRDLTRSKAAPSTSSTRCLRWCASRWLRVPSGGVRDRQVVGQLEPYRAAGLLESGGPRLHVGDIRGANAVELDIVHAPRREFVRPGADVVMRRDCCS